MSSFDLGLHTTLDDENSKLDPEVLAISASITPQLAGEFGQVWGLFGNKPSPFVTDEFEILVRNYTKPHIRVQASGASSDWDTDNETTGLPVHQDDIDRITIGDVLLVEDEIVTVKAVNRSTNVIEVYERGAGESANVAHGESEITALIVGNAHIEGRVDPEAMAEATSKLTNYLQLIEEQVDLSYANQEQARKVGRTPDVLKAEAMRRVIQDLARTAVHGVSREPLKSIPGMTRGLLAWLNLSSGIKTNVAGEFTEDVLKEALNDVRVEGGSPNSIVMSVNNKITFNKFTGADQVNQDVNERTAGRVIERYLADGLGAIPVVVDLDFPDDKIAIVDTNKMTKGWKQNDTLRFVEETNTHSRQVVETLQGKFGLAVENVGQSHNLLTGITPSGS